MAESLHCSPETTTTLLTDYIPIQNKKLEVRRKKKKKQAIGTYQYYKYIHCLSEIQISNGHQELYTATLIFPFPKAKKN